MGKLHTMQIRRTAVWALGVLVLLLAGGQGLKAAIDAQRPKGTDIQQLMRMLVDGQAASERGSASGITHFIAEDYRDGFGMNAPRLRYSIVDFFRRQRVKEMLIPSSGVQIRIDPGGESGTVQFPVRMSLVGPGGDSSQEFTLRLRMQKEPVRYFGVFPGAEWRVTSADGYSPLLD